MSSSSPKEWKPVPLGSLAEFRNGLNFTKKNFGVGVKIIGVADFQDYTCPRYESLEEINPEGIVSDRDLLKPGDVLFVRSNGNRSLIGRSLYIQSTPEPLTHSAFTIRTRFTSDDVVPRFYAYVFRTQFVRRTLTAYGGGTNISNLNQGILQDLQVPLPPTEEQHKIVAILSAYDDLIENNLRRTKILAEMAQVLYCEWFVKFRFPSHETVRMVDSPLGMIPEGWKVTGILQTPYFEFFSQNIRAYDGKKVYYATADVDGIEITGEGVEYAFEEKPSRAQKEPELNSVWFARMQETYKIIPFTNANAELCQRCMLSSGFAGFRSRDAGFFAFLFCTIKSDDFHSRKDLLCTGATQRSLTNEGMSRIQVLVPPRELVERFGKAVDSNIDLILTLQRQNKVLRRTRDLLLPKLISGELDVSELDIAIPEEAA